MSESSDAPGDPAPSDEVTARVVTDGVAVRKTANPHGEDAVAVYFTLQSFRDGRCTVRIADAIPEPLREHTVEFHPRYDPVNWTRADGAVVYAATLSPDANRTTVYGVAVDDLAQVELFAAEPAVEVFEDDTPEEFGGVPANDSEGSFDFDAGTTDRDASAEDRPAVTSEAASYATDDGSPSQRTRFDPGRTGRPTPGRDPDRPIESLVAAVRRRDLTEPERRALRDALGIDEPGPATGELESLREEVGALRDEVASADRQAADVDRLERRLEALSGELDDRYESLSADLADLQESLEQEVHWRTELQRSIGADPEASEPDLDRESET